MKRLMSLLLCLLMVMTAVIIPAAAREEKSPAIYLSFDEAVDGVVSDLAGSYDATLKGNATLGDGLLGKALLLDGTNSYAALPTGANMVMGDKYSISVWTNITVDSYPAHILDFGNSNSHYAYLASNYSGNGGPRWTLKDNGSK